MQQQIQTYYQTFFPDKQNLQVSEPERIAGGWETEIFSFDIDYTLTAEPIHESIIMRMFPNNNAQEKSAKEFDAMRQIYDVGYPVPQVYHLELENSPWGKPFILMERIEGEILWPQLDDSNEEKQQALMTQFCGLLVQLHQLDWQPFSDTTRDYLTNGYQFIDAILDEGAAQISQLGLLGFLPLIGWLQERREVMICESPSLIHFDFHPANIMLRSDGTAVVLDWSGFNISDARLDLAWTLVLMNAYGGTDSRNNTLQAYQRLLGSSVKQINYFEVFACVRRLFSIVGSIQGGAEKMGMDASAVTLMKEQMFAHRRVYELLIEETGIHVPEVEGMFTMFS